jgi:hypothetical protein
MKLFGAHVYPKNKYLTLQMTRSAKGVVCEDVFESLVSVVSLTFLSNYVHSSGRIAVGEELPVLLH